MLNIEAYAKGYKWTQITKTRAKRLFYSDESIGICPNKCIPSDSPFNSAIIIKRTNENFNNVVDYFVAYMHKELGTYPHFYKLEELP